MGKRVGTPRGRRSVQCHRSGIVLQPCVPAGICGGMRRAVVYLGLVGLAVAGFAGIVRAENHWSFIPERHVSPPKVSDEAWVRNVVDRFILACLDRERLNASPETDRRTLIRRLSFDLTGLPPT